MSEKERLEKAFKEYWDRKYSYDFNPGNPNHALNKRAFEEGWSANVRDKIEAWAIFSNTDLTEGKGTEYISRFCRIRSTAVRLAHKAYVMGSDAPVLKIELERKNKALLGPVTLVEPTEDDKRRQKIMDTHEEVISKARSLGMTDDEINMIRMSTDV